MARDVCNDFEAGNIRYKCHCEGLALKIETCLDPEMATRVARAVWAKKVLLFRTI
jgi:hypothetical protein